MTDVSRDAMLSTPEAGRRLGISTREVYDLIEAGQLPVRRTADGPQIPSDAVERRLRELG